jgi:hypothetical protein
MAKRFAPGDITYTQGGLIPIEVIGEMFEAARMLYRSHPWEKMYNSDILRIDIHDEGITEPASP